MKALNTIFLYALLMVLSGCADNAEPDSGHEGLVPFGAYHLDWSAGFASTPSFHINVYTQNLIDYSTITYDGSFWRNWCSAGWMESDSQLMECVVSKENLHIGFAPEEGRAPGYVGGKDLARVLGILNNTCVQKIKPFIPYAEVHYGSAFSTCKTRGEIVITADKTLFGIAPGENLSERFVITSADPQFRAYFPSFDVIDTDQSCLGLSAKAFFVADMALCHMRQNSGLYEIAFSEIPSEDYEEITFTINLPVSTYNNCYEWLKSGRDILSLDGESLVMSGVTTVYFGKTAQENWHLNKVERMKGSLNRDRIEYW